MNMLQKLKKNKKGFTLVELLVVLVILAILAAAIIPSMMGFIDKAKEESAAAECRSVILAGDVVLNEMYGTDSMGTPDANGKYTLKPEDVQTIADLPVGTDGKTRITSISALSDGATPAHYFISDAVYIASNGTSYTYAATTPSNGTWSVTAP